MLSFLNSTYVVCIEFLDKDGNIIKDIKKKKEKEDSSKSGESSYNVEITKDIFCYTGMEVFFEMEKIPKIVLHSKCTDTDFISKVGTFMIKVDSITKYHDEKSLNKEEQISVSFPATPITIDTKNAWETTWWCIMDVHKNIYEVGEQYFVPSTLLNDKYKFEEKEKVFTKLKLENGKWIKTTETKKVKVPNYTHYKKYSVDPSLKSDVSLSDALTDLTTLTFHQPSEGVLNLSKSVNVNGFSNVSKVEALEKLVSLIPVSSNDDKPKGSFFTFKKIRTIGDNLEKDYKIKLIEPKGKITTKNTTSSKEQERRIENYDLTDFISYQRDSSGRIIPKDVKDGNNKSIKDVLMKNMILENCIKYEYNTEVPSKISIGDPVLIFTSFDGSKLYGGFVTYEKLIFDHKIRGFYEISANPNFVQRGIVEVKDTSSIHKNNKVLNLLFNKNPYSNLMDVKLPGNIV